MSDTNEKTDNIAKYDAACKEVLSQKVILAWIMKACMVEYEAYTIDEIVHSFIESDAKVSCIPVDSSDNRWLPVIQGDNVEDVSLFEGSITYDIRFTAITPSTGRRMWIDVEPQDAFYPGYPLLKRGTYYIARMISAQRGREFIGSDYNDLKKVYTVWICTNPPKKLEHTIQYYDVRKRGDCDENLPKNSDYDLMTQIMVCLGDPDDPRATGILRLLSVLLTTTYSTTEKARILKTEFDISITGTLRKGITAMCNLGEGIYRQGQKDGLEIGAKKEREGLNSLYRRLLSERRFDDVKRATEDEDYLEKLLCEYTLA